MSKATKLVKDPILFFKDSRYKLPYTVILFPMVVVAFYLYLFSVEKYRSSATYLVKDNASKANIGFDLGIFGTSVSSQKQDASILEAYLASDETLDWLDQEFGLKDAYHSGKTDLLHRLTPFSTREDFLALYRKNLSIVHDDLAGLITLSFMDSNPEKAREVVSSLLRYGEVFLNRLNRESAEKRIAFLGQQLKKNRETLDGAIKKLKEFQDAHSIVDPKTEMELQHAIIANIEGTLVEKRAELNQLRSYLKDDTIEIVKLSDGIKEMEKSLSATRAKLSGKEKERLNDLMFQYENLKADVSFATQVYKETLVQFEVGKMEALQQSKVLEVITKPDLPEEYVWPDKPKTLMTLAFLLVLFYKIGQLMIAVVMDHRD